MKSGLPDSIVQLRSIATGNAIGTGFFVTDAHVVTCAHVINDVLGRDQGSAERPTETFLLFGPNDSEHTATVTVWAPMRSEKSGLRNDVAVLTVVNAAKNNHLPLGETAGVVGKEFETFGFPFSFNTQGRSASGTIGGLAFNHRFQLVHGPSATFHHVEGGFSGAPVLVGHTVVGMVSAVHSQNDSSGALGYMIPIEEIVSLITESDKSAKLISISDPIFGNVSWMLDYLESRIRRPATDYEFELRVRPVAELSEVTAIHLDQGQQGYRAEDLKPEDFVLGRPRHPFIVFAPGGAGKSTFLARVIRAAKANGVVPFLLDMAKEKVNPTTFKDFFTTFACNAKYCDFESCIEQRKDIILVIDGLNERPASLDGEEVSTINKFCEINTGVRVIITDRIKRRNIRYPLFEKATILPISRDDVEQAIGKGNLSEIEIRLLSSPFFLDLFLDIRTTSTARDGRSTRIKMFRDFFRFYLELADSELAQLANISIKAFEMGQGPLLASSEWENLAKQVSGMPDVLSRLLSAGVLVQREDSKLPTLHFRHQLFHDFLNAQALVDMGEAYWRPAMFDICTLRAASYEVIELAAEILEKDSDALLSEVYDWNYGAVLDCVKNLQASKHGGTSKVAEEFRNAVFILSAEKKFDRFEHTAERASRNYPQLESTLPFLAKIKSVDDLVCEVGRELKTNQGSEFWKKWVGLYTKVNEVTDDELRLLWADPVTAWTAANVFRRFRLSRSHCFALQEVFRSLASAAKDSRRSIGARWRIVHVLGVSTTEVDQNFLVNVVLDKSEDRWVQYGAVRALMESLSMLSGASRHARRKKILKKIIDGMHGITNAEVRVEMRRVAFLATHVPERGDWAGDYIQVLEAGLQQSIGLGDQGKERAEWTSTLAAARQLSNGKIASELNEASEATK
ncbi:trypsin-like peptidase domain-containing protein [Paraburkholderia caffeinilytica]|uniref:trypsin-like peptidase domain-containing protein n=1 Tax=Paraburkholderia caffeinilytica TaxID=1761016 RepID=UPI0038BC26F4